MVFINAANHQDITAQTQKKKHSFKIDAVYKKDQS